MVIMQRYDSCQVLKFNSLLGHKVFGNNLGASCVNLAKCRRLPFSYEHNFESYENYYYSWIVETPKND